MRSTFEFEIRMYIIPFNVPPWFLFDLDSSPLNMLSWHVVWFHVKGTNNPKDSWYLTVDSPDYHGQLESILDVQLANTWNMMWTRQPSDRTGGGGKSYCWLLKSTLRGVDKNYDFIYTPWLFGTDLEPTFRRNHQDFLFLFLVFL